MKNIITAIIRFYQIAISPLFPPTCRFTPTCSQYAIEAINLYGITKGSIKAVCRIFRCHPWHEGGFDPVDK